MGRAQARPIHFDTIVRRPPVTITKFAVPCLLLLAMAGPASAAETLPEAIAAAGESVVLSVHAEGAQVDRKSVV